MGEREREREKLNTTIQFKYSLNTTIQFIFFWRGNGGREVVLIWSLLGAGVSGIGAQNWAP